MFEDNPEEALRILESKGKSITYLNDSGVEIDGIKINEDGKVDDIAIANDDIIVVELMNKDSQWVFKSINNSENQ